MLDALIIEPSKLRGPTRPARLNVLDALIIETAGRPCLG